jgi:hypothetical protein
MKQGNIHGGETKRQRVREKEIWQISYWRWKTVLQTYDLQFQFSRIGASVYVLVHFFFAKMRMRKIKGNTLFALSPCIWKQNDQIFKKIKIWGNFPSHLDSDFSLVAFF